MEVKSKLSHSGIGLLSVFAYTISIYLSVVLILLFFTYEFVEVWVIRDKAYPEIREFTVGFAVGVILYSQEILEDVVLLL